MRFFISMLVEGGILARLTMFEVSVAMFESYS